MSQKSYSKVRKSGKTEATPRQVLQTLQDSAAGFRIRDRDYLDIARNIWEGLNTPKSLACALLLKYKEYAQLVSLSCSVSDYLYTEIGVQTSEPGGSRFRDDYLAVSLLKKWPGFEHESLDPLSACVSADEAAEESCRLTNRRIRNALADPKGSETAHLHLLLMMQADIARVLGPFDPQKWEYECRFGPGKASGQQGLIDSEKLMSQPSSTPLFAPYGSQLIASSDPWTSCLSSKGHIDFADPSSQNASDITECEEEVHRFMIRLEPGDKNICVPKNAKTHRGIRPQPGLNVYAQLGIGNMMRSRLQSAGLDLDDQIPNQNLAKLGSLPKYDYVTVDLKGASGHICKELVNQLFVDAPRWLFAMNICRTHLMLQHGEKSRGWVEASEEDGSGGNPGNWVSLQSYSAMGNGYTFELETLIFWSAVRACRRIVKDTQQYRVYGDDIICSRETADVLIPFLAFLGFPLNQSKTFLEGPFRESCGADFWLGTNVRPIHLSITSDEIKEANKNGTAILRWMQTINSVRRIARRRNLGHGSDLRLLRSWRTALLVVPQFLRACLKGPWEDIRDDVIITDVGDALTNPLIRRCGSLHALVGPRLHVTVGEQKVSSAFQARATMLYRLQSVDRVALRYDKTRSWLRRVLQNAETSSPMGKQCDSWAAIKPSKGHLMPNLWSLGLGAGWEVFQPVGDVTEWLHMSI